MTNILLIITLSLVAVNFIFCLVLLLRKRFPSEQRRQIEEIRTLATTFQAMLAAMNETVKSELGSFRSESYENFQASRNELGERIAAFEKAVKEDAVRSRGELAKSLKDFSERLDKSIEKFETTLQERFDAFSLQQRYIKEETEKQLEKIRTDNEKQLSEMRKTVDEKLQTTLEKRLSESFKAVSERLEQVHKGLGEMQKLATGVGDLKKVLSNVKTRGTFGEYQLKDILDQILTQEQYGEQVSVKDGSEDQRGGVDFAVKMPGKMDDEKVLLPIDAKFPLEAYERLLAASEAGDRPALEAATKELVTEIKKNAKSIREKYIKPPKTTDFAVMFLPSESLYAEVLRVPGLVSELQLKHRVTVTGPTTMTALLNSLRMGFQTLMVQKRSSEVWEVLSGVKEEFGKFSEILDKVHTQINTAAKTVETLRTTRTNQINRKLKGVGTLEGILSGEEDNVPPLLPVQNEE